LFILYSFQIKSNKFDSVKVGRYSYFINEMTSKSARFQGFLVDSTGIFTQKKPDFQNPALK